MSSPTIMNSSATKVFQNKKILSKVFDFLGDNDIRNVFLPTSNKQILIYGQVQSGKTAKIMEYIKNTQIKTKILMIQNSLSMLAQYERALDANKIHFRSITTSDIYLVIHNIKRFNFNIVLLVMNNNYRRDALDLVILKAKIRDYSLIMDESDLYYKNIINTSLYKKASECVHITATPFSPGYKSYFDEVIVIPPKKEYVGFDKLDIKFIPDVQSEYETTMNIITTDFLTAKQGIMLITIHHRVSQMENYCRYLSNQSSLINVPIVMLSSKNVLYFNNKIKELSRMSISQIITGLQDHQHIIFIANRLATRGINYSDLTYSRHLTHQIIKKNDSKTNFIQRCRILGNKPGLKQNFKLYCFNCDLNYFQNVLKKIHTIHKDINYFKFGHITNKPKPKPQPKLLRSKTM
jgi:hypothetical protein